MDNRSVIRRAVAIGLAWMFVLIAASPLLACGGWQPTASARLACCARLGDACAHGAGGADACCAQRESASHSNHEALVKADGSVALAPSAISTVHAGLGPAVREMALQSIARTPYADSALYLRHASLRI